MAEHPRDKEGRQLQNAIGEIHRAWKEGRPIVPLFGAGISVESGIPLTWPMVTYLVQLKWYVERSLDSKRKHDESRDITAHLLTHGWPDPHDLTAKLIPLLGRNKDDPQSLKEIEKQVLNETKLQDQPDIWLRLLSLITDGRQDLKDLFFDRLEAGREPSTCHQFIAFLTMLMNWRLILTTNFDPFIEQALRNIGVEPRMYELPDLGPVPNPELVKSHRSILKLHGGSFARVMSESLSHALGDHEREQLLKYLPDAKQSLMLIVGYSGGDRRVMSVLHDFVHSGNADRSVPRIIWVDQSNDPEFSKGIFHKLKVENDPSKVLVVQGTDGARFLQELYSRLTTTHPATPTSYSVFSHRPRLVKTKAKQPSASKIVLFHSEGEGSGTSRALSQFVLQKRGYTVIWCDLGLGVFASVEAVFSFLERELRKYDPAIPPFSIFPAPAGKKSKDRRISYIVEAMERGRYVIAFDSLGEFRTAHITDDFELRDYLKKTEVNAVISELGGLYYFLTQLAEQIANSVHCESVLCMAHTPLYVGHETTIRNTKKMASKFIKGMKNIKGTEFPLFDKDSSSLVKLAEDVWSCSTFHTEQRLVLCICAVFRRPRSIVVLRRFLAIVLQPEASDDLSFANVTFAGHSESITIEEKTRDEVDKTLDDLCEEGLLVREDGGFFWMHRLVRDTLYKQMRKEYREEVANLHNAVASYYYHDVYLPSKDTEALFEYIYHRVASMRIYSREADQSVSDKNRNIRARELVVVMQRERDQLLTDQRSGLLIPWIRYLRDTELEALAENITADCEAGREFQAIYEDARSVLCELEAECLRQSGAYAECIILRSKQIDDRLYALTQDKRRAGESRSGLVGLAQKLQKKDTKGTVKQFTSAIKTAIESAGGASTSSTRLSIFLRLIDHVVEVAACLNGLHLPYHSIENVLKKVDEAIMLASKTIGVDQVLREQLRDLRIRLSHRRMELELSRLSGWNTEVRRRTKNQLEHVETLFRDGDDELRAYTGHRDRNFYRYTCVLNTFRAKCAYLNGDFGEAYRWLEAASAAIRRPIRGSEFSTRAICLMHHAECLIYHAEERLNPHTTRTKIDLIEWSRAKSKLERARDDLERAQNLLIQGRPQLWAWTHLFTLWAQLDHEFLLLSLDQDADVSELSNTQEAKRLRMYRDRYILSGLRSIRAALDSGAGDELEVQASEILWLQLYVCQAFRESIEGSQIGQRSNVLTYVEDYFLDGNADTQWREFNQLARLDKQCANWRKKYRKSLGIIVQNTQEDVTTVRKIILNVQQTFVFEFFGIGSALSKAEPTRRPTKSKRETNKK